MTANVGSIDRLVRLVVGAALLVFPLLDIPPIWASQPLAIGSMIVGAILIGTALFGVCPIYRLIGIGTKRS